MAENPDYKDPTHKGFAPSGSDLRFVQRLIPDDKEGRCLRILQRYEWSSVDAKWAWYDVQLAEEE